MGPIDAGQFVVIVILAALLAALYVLIDFNETIGAVWRNDLKASIDNVKDELKRLRSDLDKLASADYAQRSAAARKIPEDYEDEEV